MRKVIVHAGFHKTATTSFQEFCRQNRTALRRRGIGYARLDYGRTPDHPNHSYPIRLAYGAAEGGDNSHREALVRELGRQVEDCGRLLVSGEIIAVLAEPAKMLLLQDLRELADELCFVLLVRHPKTYFESMLNEHLKNWADAGANVFKMSRDTLTAIVDHDWGSLYTKRLEFFRARLTDEELIVRKYEDATRSPDGVIGFLLGDCLGLHLSPADYASSRHANVAPSHETLLLGCALKSLCMGAAPLTINTTKRLIDRLARAAPRNGSRPAFAAALEPQLPSMGPQLSWLETNFGIHYDLDAAAFAQPDVARLWPAQFTESLLDFAQRQLDGTDQRLLAAAFDFVARWPGTLPEHAVALAAAAQRLQHAMRTAGA